MLIHIYSNIRICLIKANKMNAHNININLKDVSRLFHACFSELSYHPNPKTTVRSEVN
jgi:UDP-N-acetylglucosamine pyrophosphorylase